MTSTSKRRWTQDEIELLRKKRDILSVKQLARLLNRGVGSVNWKIYSLKIAKFSKRRNIQVNIYLAADELKAVQAAAAGMPIIRFVTNTLMEALNAKTSR